MYQTMNRWLDLATRAIVYMFIYHFFIYHVIVLHWLNGRHDTIILPVIAIAFVLRWLHHAQRKPIHQ